MAKTDLAILIKTLYDGKGAGSAKKDLKGLEKQSSKAGATLKGMGAILGTVGIGLATAGVAAMAAKKAFEFSREGAALNQLEESFDRMNASVFKTPDLLNRMTEASKGTIKESQLMAGLLTLTAGASNELASAMAAASPKLVEIAKAANKLNPTLGDTGFLYESLARGIKRSSPLILDNTGLVIKIGEANEEWAAKAGMTVEAMSAQDKQMALLEAALKAGDKLIQQVGGSVDAQTDSYDRLTTAYGEFLEMVKKDIATKDKLVPFLADELDLRNRSIKAFNILQEAYERGAISGRKLDTAYRLMNASEELFLEKNAALIASLLQSERELEANSTAAKLARESERRLRGTTEELTESTEDLEVAEKELADALKESGLRAWEATEALKARQALIKEVSDHINDILITAEEKAAEVAEKAAEATRKLREEMLGLAQSITSGNASLGLFNEELGQLGPQLITIGGRTADQNRLLGMATDEYDKLGQKISDMSAAPVLFGKSVDEANEAIDGMIERQGELNPLIEEFGSITATAAMVVKEATWNEDALNKALFENAAALLGNQEEVYALALEFGFLNEQQAAAMLQHWTMYNIHLPALGEALAAGAISTNTAQEAMMLLAGGFVETWQEAVALIGTVDELAGVLDGLPLEKQIRIKITTIYDQIGQPGKIPGEGPQIDLPQIDLPKPVPDVPDAFQRGADFMVPTGFPNDSFPIRVQSGEHVTVTPAGRSRGGRGSVTIYAPIMLMGGGNPAFIGQRVAKRNLNLFLNNTRG